MKLLRKYSEIILLIVLALCVFFITINFQYPFDTYYHIKAGQVFVQQGIIFYDVFSNVAYGRMWYPYEWLFQIAIYYLQLIAGFHAIAYFVSVSSVLQILLVYYILKKLFKIPVPLLIILTLIYTVGIHFYLIARPNLIANLFFLISTFSILLYMQSKKNFLWITVPITLLWINLHASFILLLFLLGSYAFFSVVLYYLDKDKIWLQKAKVLALYTVGIFLLTLTPPLYGTQYQLLWLFFRYSQTAKTIIEWAPLLATPTLFYTYTLVLALIAASIYLVREKITRTEFILAIPLVFIAITPYLAFRNILFGWFAVAIILSLTIERLLLLRRKRLLLGSYLGVLIITMAIYNSFIPFYNKDAYTHNPEQAANFILRYKLKGNMYNFTTYGAYLMYRLYPQQKVFTDGRLDVFMCCELFQVQALDNIFIPQDQYKRNFLGLLDRYHISFVLSTRDITSQYQITILSHDPDWSLVYWDDSAQIFVRRYDMNDSIIKRFGAVSARPDDASLYDFHNITHAISEYNRMISISDSAKSRNILGIIYLRQQKIAAANEQFQKAIQLNAEYPPPYVNLAYIAVKQQEYQQAITYYQEAIKQGSTDPVPFITLGELYIKVDNDSVKAREVWQEGLAKVTDEGARDKFAQLLRMY